MAKSGVNKKYAVNASGVLNIEDGQIYIEVEDVDIYKLDKLLEDFNGLAVKINATYEELQESPDIDSETGEILE